MKDKWFAFLVILGVFDVLLALTLFLFGTFMPNGWFDNRDNVLRQHCRQVCGDGHFRLCQIGEVECLNGEIRKFKSSWNKP